MVVGSRSQLLTTDFLGSEKIIIGDGGKGFFDSACMYTSELNLFFVSYDC